MRRNNNINMCNRMLKPFLPGSAFGTLTHVILKCSVLTMYYSSSTNTILLFLSPCFLYFNLMITKTTMIWMIPLRRSIAKLSIF